jgi:hypothetical protein
MPGFSLDKPRLPQAWQFRFLPESEQTPGNQSGPPAFSLKPLVAFEIERFSYQPSDGGSVDRLDRTFRGRHWRLLLADGSAISGSARKGQRGAYDHGFFASRRTTITFVLTTSNLI